MARELATIAETHRRNNGYYHGENGDWLVAYTSHRDADVLDRANIEAFKRILDAIEPTDADNGPDWCVETSSHWAVGYVEYLLVRPNTEAHTQALDVIEAYNDYPVIDEELYSSMEYEESLDGAKQAFEYWYYRHSYSRDIDGSEVAPYIWHYYVDTHSDYPTAEFWPDDAQCFWGYVAYRRANRHAT